MAQIALLPVTRNAPCSNNGVLVDSFVDLGADFCWYGEEQRMREAMTLLFRLVHCGLGLRYDGFHSGY